MVLPCSHRIAVWLIVFVCAPVLARAQPLPEWTQKIRSDHPRLFFNADTFPAVKRRAVEEQRDWYRRLKVRTDQLETRTRGTPNLQPQDLGPEAATAAFIFLVTQDDRYLQLARKCLRASIEHYEACYDQRKTVNWYSTSRVHAVMAWDWLYNDLAESERREIMTRLVQTIDRVIKAKPAIYRENISGYNTGFYGVKNCRWFIGCTAFGTDIETSTVDSWLVWGHDENHRLLVHRQRACGDDGGGASPTLGYVFGAYPWSEQNFFYTWLSATGENIAPDWPHGASLVNYVNWNWIAADPLPLQFGYGDTPHTNNRLPIAQLTTHMANIRHLYGRAAPEAARLARHIQSTLPNPTYSRSWFIYPFLLADLESSPAALAPDALPHARHFDAMGQVFMRSGVGPEDTYCLFTCGGLLKQHRHFDALNFVIYHRGFLAVDSGTRYDEFTNGQHLANYFAQTVAHNCVVIHQPDEPPARYWGGTVEGNHGGQHRQLGSTVKAFETNDRFVYVAGDATACYQHGVIRGKENNIVLPEKCELATRQLVFLMPDHFIIFDRIKTTDSSYQKDWLLHTARGPVIEGQTFRADHGEGRMWCRTLLPQKARLTAVGGHGNEFFAAGKNWALDAPRLTPQQLDMIGRWRVEVSPSEVAKEDLFLHVIQVGDQQLSAMGHVALIEKDGICGVKLTNAPGTWEVVFHTTGEIGGHISLSGTRGFNRPLTTNVLPQRATPLSILTLHGRQVRGFSLREKTHVRGANGHVQRKPDPKMLNGVAQRGLMLQNAPLKIDANYPGGNIIVGHVDGDTVQLRQDLRHTKGWWFWWNFRVRGAAGRTGRFQFAGQSPIGVRGPAFTVDGGTTWSWLGAEAVDGSSFKFAFGPDAGDVRFAFAVPYQRSNLDRFLRRHGDDMQSGRLAVETLCKTRKGRDVPLIRVHCPKAERKYRVLVTARHHACETMASYVLEGLLDTALSDTEVGKRLRQHVELVAVPLVDCDGVADGDQGKNRMPRDHNRDYAGTSIYAETRAIRTLASTWPPGSLTAAIDLHCPWIRGPHNDVIYMVGSPHEAIEREQQTFGRILQRKQSGPLAYNMTNNIPFGTAWNTAKNYTQGMSFSRWASQREGIRMATTFEVPYAEASGQPVTPESARDFGHDLATALAAYLEQLP